MDMNLLHDITFYTLYGAAAIAAFIAVERGIYFSFSLRQAKKLEAVLNPTMHAVEDLPAALCQRNSLPLEMLETLFAHKQGLATHKDLEDLSESIYISTRSKLMHGLWLLETVVTAAPLLGLLGTILGIIDTFKALAETGVSDPGEVSKGIGTALYATALGIAVALGSMIFHNHFQDRVERITDHLKILLLRAGMGTTLKQVEVPQAIHGQLQSA
ncbi:MotA/TolQ/ExbB proton channel family protein [Pseudomonas sp. FW306-02-F02-AA]|uniref:Biopolymer transporter ExbB n=1 Tax=Pseudomonas fluorescens TaxID=294 RepID=A0A0N7GZI3_PSEFL|nr:MULTISPECIES: MotA/TolQ/ExbB proton channel family protein [Pseudomonas]ALI00420.1 biopolymer transporter ExbB [Pseudomonas fluorescens]PMZ01224.1 MotA/TolQ/ExbB proton channel family protein [Pseudomonas sp. FW306-02-F02-AB]PMZ07117.1 MotA/TolQ/ExbB proton channel family protein [Pseudomonas sp. FW306-02-H06C]PMZ16334.1 MotA/TolQ/ExbB proton channel family protein [Pseudomonas sp. FW306-02-F02-AA]PMZ22275.1 biopolymer transporter ExbB [Pseudomonas sp. FW306-02-F08-AA]